MKKEGWRVVSSVRVLCDSDSFSLHRFPVPVPGRVGSRAGLPSLSITDHRWYGPVWGDPTRGRGVGETTEIGGTGIAEGVTAATPSKPSSRRQVTPPGPVVEPIGTPGHTGHNHHGWHSPSPSHDRYQDRAESTYGSGVTTISSVVDIGSVVVLRWRRTGRGEVVRVVEYIPVVVTKVYGVDETILTSPYVLFYSGVENDIHLSDLKPPVIIYMVHIDTTPVMIGRQRIKQPLTRVRVCLRF